MTATAMMELACRDRLGVFNASFFRMWTCSMCYSFLFHDSAPSFTAVFPAGLQLVDNSSTDLLLGVTLHTDLHDEHVVRLVCGTLEDVQCRRWTDCCRAAEDCCKEQSSSESAGWRGVSLTTTRRGSHPYPPYSGSPRSVSGGESAGVSYGEGWESTSGVHVETGSAGLRYCPGTWDGFGCFKDTAAGQTASISCPSYIDQSTPGARAHKQCTENGTWWTNPTTGQEWTDYTSCVQMDAFRTLYYVRVTCNTVSLLLLIPACIIFLCYHKLREQHRVKMHVHLFTSFILSNVGMVLWENLVYNNRFHTRTKETSFMHKDTVGCKMLYVWTRYAMTCNFCWMFLEGFHLHRLIVKAFEVPKSILGYYIVGWGGSWVPVLIYVIIRAVREDSGCWVHNIAGIEWIIYTPILLCIVVNLFFLFSILRILLTQLTTHPNEPSNYRRALKATSVLVPLFGLQLFVVIYNPAPHNVTRRYAYEVISALVTHSQGALVALIFCFFNKEVLSHLKQLKARCGTCVSRQHQDSKAVSSHTYVMTERALQGPNGLTSRSPGSMRGQYVAVTTQDRPGLVTNGGAAENFV